MQHLVSVLLVVTCCSVLLLLYSATSREDLSVDEVVDRKVDQVMAELRAELILEVERRGRAQENKWAQQLDELEQRVLSAKEKVQSPADHAVPTIPKDQESKNPGSEKKIETTDSRSYRFTEEGIPDPSTIPPLHPVPNEQLDALLAKRAHHFKITSTDHQNREFTHHGKDVVLVVFNKGYVDLLRNLLCTLDKLNITNLVGIALDEEALADCPRLGIECVLPGAEFLRAGSTHFHYHGNADFKSLSKLKSRNVLEVLLRGYNVMLIDGDIVFFRDPLTYLRNGSIHYDLQIQSDSPYGLSKNAYLNTGCYYMAANPRTVMFLDVLWAYGMTNAVNQSEQSAFAGLDYRIQQGKVPGMTLRRVNLELHEFCNGHTYFLPNPPDGTYQPRPDASTHCYVLHFNWIFGANKLKTMKANRFWFVDAEGNCQTPATQS